MTLSLRTLVLALLLPVFVSFVARAAEPAITHSFLATGAKTYILQFDASSPEGRVVWEYPAATREGWVLPNGNLLLAITKGNTYPGGAAVEITRSLEVVWEYKGTQLELNSVQKTPQGTYVVTESGPKPRLLELDRANKVLVEFPLLCQSTNPHEQTRMARKLADGTYLAPHLRDFAVRQYDRTGKVLREIDTTLAGDSEHKVRSWPFTAIRLKNGNTLCGLTLSDRVAEFDPQGRKVWELTNDDVGGLIKNACGVQRLPNGNTIVNNYGAGANEVKLFEVTPDKKVVWRYQSPDKTHIHHFQVIDTNGSPLQGPALR